MIFHVCSGQARFSTLEFEKSQDGCGDCDGLLCGKRGFACDCFVMFSWPLLAGYSLMMCLLRMPGKVSAALQLSTMFRRSVTSATRVWSMSSSLKKPKAVHQPVHVTRTWAKAWKSFGGVAEVSVCQT